MPSVPVQQAIAKLRDKTLRTARGFYDYNFRAYFVQHVKDDFAAVNKLPAEAQKAFLEKEGPTKLREMQRMVLLNRMYSHQPVFLDKKKDGQPIVPPAKDQS